MKFLIGIYLVVIGSFAVSAQGFNSPQIGRPLLSANTTFYVATTGNNNNSCLTVGAPCLTIMGAINKIAKYDLNLFNVVLQLADGTYIEHVLVPALPGATGLPEGFTIRGNCTTPANTIVRNNTSFQPAIEVQVGTVGVECFRVTAPNSGYGINAAQAGTINIKAGMDFGDCTGQYQIFANNGGTVNILGNYTISGPANAHWAAAFSGNIYGNGTIINANGGAYNYTFAFAGTYNNGNIQAQSMIFSNVASITGSRYAAQSNATIQTFGGGANYIPGNAVGTVSNGGVYQ